MAKSIWSPSSCPVKVIYMRGPRLYCFITAAVRQNGIYRQSVRVKPLMIDMGEAWLSLLPHFFKDFLLSFGFS